MTSSLQASVVALLNTLRQFNLLDKARLDKLAASANKYPDAKALAAYLVQKGLLTAYQANQLVQGKGAELVLGNYILLEKLGEGGMGQVFKAKQSTMGRLVALKVIHKERANNPKAIQRFKREIQVASKVNHQNIVLALASEEVGGRLILVMEYVEGSDLHRFVEKKGPLSIGAACNYIAQAALGLQHASEQGLVHRDIKPHNLLLGKDGVVKILDLGLARGSEAGQYTTLTVEGSVLGTPDYLAPEQALDSHTSDIRADIYSLGATFYYLLTGSVLFPGGSLAVKILKHQTAEPASLKEVRPDVPDQVAAVVQRMLAKKPEDRFQTPAEVAAALRGIGHKTTRAPRERKKRARLLPFAIAAGLFLALIAGAAMVMNWSSPPETQFVKGTGTRRSTPSSSRKGGSGGNPGPTTSKSDSGSGPVAKAPAFNCRFSPEREKLLREGGGNEESEKAVSRGLKWIVQQQKMDGGWTLEGYDQGMGHKEHVVAATALALLPLLGKGESHLEGSYRQTVKSGLDYLIRKQGQNGRFSGIMYEHALATDVVCEAYGLTKDDKLRPVAQNAISFIAEAQHTGGGWRYNPKEEGDTSVTGWYLMALQTGKAAGLDVPKHTLNLVSTYLDNVAQPDGSYRYMREEHVGTASTAIGLLARLHLGWDTNRPELLKGVSLLKDKPPALARKDIYYYYYATQVMHHVGGDSWDSWNLNMRNMLIQQQDENGSWPPAVYEAFGKVGGRLMVTSLALLTLEVYYQQVPLWKARKESPVPVIGKGTLVLEIEPEQAEVHLDGKLVTFVTPKVLTIEVSAEKHDLKVAMTGYKPHMEAVDMTGLSVKRLKIKLEKDIPKIDKPANATLEKKLAGTKWVNTNNVVFEWDAEGRLFHNKTARTYTVLDELRIRIRFSDTLQSDLIFNKNLTRFSQYSVPNEKTPLFIGIKINRDIPKIDKPANATLDKKLAGTIWVNTNNVVFEWDADGRLFHNETVRTYTVLDELRVRIRFSDTLQSDIIFDRNLTRFSQYSVPNEKTPLFTGRRLN